MDPTTCLQEILELFSQMNKLHPQDTARYTCRCEVVDKLAELGEWMITGGFPPEMDKINECC